MDQKTNTGWIIAGVVLLVLVLAGMMWMDAENKKKNIDNVLSEGYADLAMIRAEIQIKCDGPEANKEECDEALSELAKILEDFSDDIDVASTSMPQATTTAP